MWMYKCRGGSPVHALSSQVCSALAQESFSCSGEVRWTVWKHVMVLPCELCSAERHHDTVEPLLNKMSLLKALLGPAAPKMGNPRVVQYTVLSEQKRLLGHTTMKYIRLRSLSTQAILQFCEIEIDVFLFSQKQSCLQGLSFNWYSVRDGKS